MRVLITGADGFVGKHLANELRRTGHVPVAMGGPGARHGVDIRRRADVKAIVDEIKPDAIVHLAAMSSVRDSWNDPVAIAEVNLVGTLNVFVSARDARVPRFVFASSGEVYGKGNGIHYETDPPMPISPYADAKYSSELFLGQLAESGETSVVIMRPFTHIGAGQSSQFVIPQLAQQLLNVKKGRQQEVHVGDLDIIRDFTDVRDVVCAYRVAVERRTLSGVFNICSGQSRTLESVLGDMGTVLGMHSVPWVTDVDRRRRVDIPVMMGSSQKFALAANWRPQWSWMETLASIFQTNQLDEPAARPARFQP